MRLKRLEIAGFKSFMNRLDMDFSSGITAVLGPNGCGKTNIVDAMRWVLGEQKTRMLRNTKMENVIFNGTKLRKPLGMAEVHMTLSNEDGAANIDYGDITLTRKLFRSGVSEYYLNGEQARLKDIRGILIDTGLGSHTYSIIEREMVDSVISDKDQDKRHLLEEAAGVSRYRVQREEALRKIKQTEQDLTRLDDILVELEKELRSLKYQMSKAQRYGKLKEKVDRLELVAVKRSLLDLLEKRDGVEKEREYHEGITLADGNEITVLENHLQEARVRGSEIETGLQSLQESRYEISQSLQQREERIAILTERSTTHKNRIIESEEEIGRAKTKLDSLAEDLGDFGQTITTKEEVLSVRQKTVTEKERALDAVTGEFDTVKAQLLEKKQLALDLVREKERNRGVVEHLSNRLFEIEEKAQEENTQQSSIQAQEAGLVEKVAREKRVVEQTQERVSRGAERLETALSKTQQTLNLLALCEDRNANASIQLNRFAEKREYLQRIKDEHGRRHDAVVANTSHIKGVLADGVHVDKNYRRCFEACLGPILQGLLVSNKDDAIKCTADIRRAGKGRYQLLYPHHLGDRVDANAYPVAEGHALDFVSGDSAAMDVLKPYLANVLVARDVETAIEILHSAPSVRIATMDGVFFDGPGRILVAGAEDVDMTLLELDTKLDELDTSIRHATARADVLKNRKVGLVAAKARLAEEADELRAQLRNGEGEKELVLASYRALELDLVKTREKLANLNDNVSERQKLFEDIQAKLQDQPKAIEDVVDVDPDEQLTQLEQRALDLERERESVGAEAGQAKLEVARLIGELSTAKEKRSNIEILDNETRELIASRHDDAERCRREIDIADEEVEKCKGEIAELHKRIEAVEKDIDGARQTYEENKQECEAVEKQRKQLTEQRDQKKDNLQRCDLELNTIDTRIKGLAEKAHENFAHDLTTFLEKRELLVETDWSEIDGEDMASLRTRLESFGPVNMLALEEHNEKNERYEFLSKQKADLDEAKEALIQAIRRINREARRRLSETFEAVRANFKSTFLTLFDGGEADLLFVDSDDPLEAKIKIVASPKGKRLHDISSLSGGERALVALSLLFAIYLVKPSPFCVLDEVDAPLDDANIARFVNMLKSFTDRIQFIVITHNKKTMEAADNLYGVTMAEPGVSKMISVQLNDVDRFQDRVPPARGAKSPRKPTEEVTV